MKNKHGGGKKAVTPKGLSPGISMEATLGPEVKYTAGSKGRVPPYGCDKRVKKGHR